MPRKAHEDAENNAESAAKKAEKICAEALSKITPKRKEREETLSFTEKLLKNLDERLRSAGIEATDVNVQGSIAKDTWLAGDKDIDVFIALPKTAGREAFKKVLEVAKSLAGERWVEAYAEHPYIEAEIEGYRVEFVPCFKIERPEERASSVDRTPLHTAYVKNRLNPQAKGEIRLFKQFARGTGVYGAEIKVKGLSGYLCELLTLHYKSFLNALQEIASWRLGQVIDVENLYEGRVDDIKRIFNAPLTVVDPVDANRNVAAVISSDRLGELIMAARLFQTKPDRAFFFPPKTVPPSVNALGKAVPKLGFDLIFILLKYGRTSPDVLWGQLYRTVEGIEKLLIQNDFQVLRSSAWSDEKETNVLVFALESAKLPPSKRHLGPPADSKEAIAFIEKYVGSDVTVIGPWAEEGRWIVCIHRRCIDAASLLRSALKDNVREVGIAVGLTDDLKRSKILVNGEILDFYASNEGFAQFLTDFLMGRPKWMR